MWEASCLIIRCSQTCCMPFFLLKALTTTHLVSQYTWIEAACLDTPELPSVVLSVPCFGFLAVEAPAAWHTRCPLECIMGAGQNLLLWENVVGRIERCIVWTCIFVPVLFGRRSLKFKPSIQSTSLAWSRYDCGLAFFATREEKFCSQGVARREELGTLGEDNARAGTRLIDAGHPWFVSTFLRG